MKLIDLLLLICGVCLTIAGFCVIPALGFLAAAVSCGGAWYLLGDDS